MTRVYRLTRPEDVAAAYHWITQLSALRAAYMSASSRVEKPPTPLRVDERAMEAYRPGVERARLALEAAEAQLLEYLEAKSNEYKYIAYALTTSLASVSVVAFLAIPPDLTWGRPPTIHASTWISVAFLPYKTAEGKYRANSVQTFFATWNHVIRRMHKNRIMNRFPELHRLYEKKLAQYKAEGRPTPHAIRLAERDLLRVFIGNTWLVATLDALDQGLVTPEEIDLPYHLAQNPRLHVNDMIDPSKTSHTPARWTNYTWVRLLKELNLL